MSSSLLPKEVGQFADPAYWKRFFAERAGKVFEWYGSYSEIGTTVEKYLKSTDRIFQVGCGNSTLADDLYDNGYRHVTSVDIVPEVIQSQLEKNAKSRPELQFFACDITASCRELFKYENFQVVLDKGTLDALLPPDFDHEKTIAVNKMFEEIDRILAVGGRYVVVTLAQSDVARIWLQYFSEKSYMLRVHQVNNGGADEKWPLPTFLFVATKMYQSRVEFKIYEFLDFAPLTIPRRCKTTEELLACIVSAQEYAVFCNKAQRNTLDEDLMINLHGSSAVSNSPRYTIYLVSARCHVKKYALPYAVFIVPQGRENEWLFSTDKGRQELCVQAAAKRLAIVCLGRDQEFSSMDAVKGELDGRVMDFAPLENAGSKVPYLSLGGDDLGRRKTVLRGDSELSGNFVVEDVAMHDKDEVYFRRLVFLKSQNLIQSEAKLGEHLEIDWSRLSCAHHRVMLAALANNDPTSKSAVCLLGLGGGCLATFTWKHFKEVTLTAIEIDQAVVDIARQCFEFPRKVDLRLSCITADALQFVGETSRKDSSQRYDVVFLDVAGPSHIDGLSCPLPAFVEEEKLKELHTLVEPAGVLAFNLVTRDIEKRQEIEKSLDKYFPVVLRHKIEGELNEVLLCFASDKDSDKMQLFEKRLCDFCTRLEQIRLYTKKAPPVTVSSVEDLLAWLANEVL